MGVIIEESGMKFGEYTEEQVFRIEKCPQYTKRLLPNGIKICEFVLKRKNKLLFVEAKTSCPNRLVADSSEEKAKKYQEYLEEITSKMKHSLMIYANILLNRYENAGLSTIMSNKDMKNIEILFVLVVKNAEKEWLVPFQEKFIKLLKHDMRIWGIKDFLILTEEEAIQKKLVMRQENHFADVVAETGV